MRHYDFEIDEKKVFEAIQNRRAWTKRNAQYFVTEAIDTKHALLFVSYFSFTKRSDSSDPISRSKAPISSNRLFITPLRKSATSNLLAFKLVFFSALLEASPLR